MSHEWYALNLLLSLKLGDPDAGSRLIESLDERRVRLQVIEMCWHFGIEKPSPAERMAVRDFLDRLCLEKHLVEIEPNLYCRPDLIEGTASLDDAVAKLAGLRGPRRAKKLDKAVPKEEQKGIFAASRKLWDTANRDRDAGLLLTFARGQGATVTAAALMAEGARLGFTEGRTSHLVAHLRSKNFLHTYKYATYTVAHEEVTASLESRCDAAAERTAARKARREAAPVPIVRKKRDWRYPPVLAAPVKAEAAVPPKTVSVPVAVQTPPKPKGASAYQLRSWILIWCRDQKELMHKDSLTKAAQAAGLIEKPEEIDGVLKLLIRDTRLMDKGFLLELTEFGKRDAEYLHLRRDAFQFPLTGGA